MLATIVHDSYHSSEAQDIADALDIVCNNSFAFSAAGVYVFWDTDTKKILYIGLAIDLPRRFRQHNGIISMDIKGCKVNQIRNHFQSNSRLGYTIILQSSFADTWVPPFSPSLISGTDDWIRTCEGQLLASYMKGFGELPSWNKILGQTPKDSHLIVDSRKFFDVLTNKGDSVIVARSTLRDMAHSPDWYAFEAWLHGVRLQWLTHPDDYLSPKPEKEVEKEIDGLFRSLLFTYDFTRKSNYGQFWEFFKNQEDDIWQSKKDIVSTRYHEKHVSI